MNQQNIGKYVITGTLGRGSMGVVYKALDPEIGRSVAVKTLRKPAAGLGSEGSSALERFRTEARSAGNLRHPNLITVFEVSIEGDIPYIVMDYVEGESLDAVLTKVHRLHPPLALYYLKQVAAGIDAAHAAGVVHRDLKPSNMIVDRNDWVYVVDFGVASISVASSAAKKEPVMGTPAYMAPEQILNKQVGPRSDFFSLAVVAFEFFTGQRPFKGRNFTEVLNSILSGKPAALTSLVDLPVQLEVEFERALMKSPEGRFASAQEMVTAFARALGIERIERPVVDAEGVVDRGPQRERKSSEWRSIFKPGTGSAGFKRPNAADRLRRVSEHIEGLAANEGTAQPRPAPSRNTGKSADIPALDRPEPVLGGAVTSPGQLFRRGGEIRSQTIGLSQTSFFKERRIELTILVVVLTIFASLAILVVSRLFESGEQGKNQRGADRPDSGSDGTGLGAPAFVYPEDPLLLPQVEPAPNGLLVAEMTDKQVLGILLDEDSAGPLTVQALEEAARRQIPDFIGAASVPLQNPSHLIRIKVLETLGVTKNPTAVALIVSGLDDHDPLVRQAAAEALADLGSSRALGYLTQRHGREESPQVRSSIVKAMEAIAGYPLPEYYERNGSRP